MEKRSKKFLGVYVSICLIAIAIIVTSLCDYCKPAYNVETDTLRIEHHDTLIVEVHDSVPVLKSETIVKYIENPFINSNNEESEDSLQKNDSLAVVQKCFSDDSTYTAYVSGIKYEEYPKLDSVITRNRIITNTIHDIVTITKKEKAPRFSFGLQGGVGYSIISGRIEPYIGVGGSFRLGN